MAESSLGQIYTESKKEVDALDARLLIQSVLNITATDFISRPDIQILPSDLELIHRLIHRRKSGEPVSKILGQGAFWSRDFIVTPDVLDPRPDTELLIEVALDGKVPETILDIGTGSGCIPITLLCEWTDARAVSVDISEKALKVAAENSSKHKVCDRLSLVESDLDKSVDNSMGDGGRFDLIVSNPPYIPTADIESLSVDVRDHDPILALDGGDDGLDFYKKIILIIKNRLKPNGRGLLEIGAGQDESVPRLVEQQGLVVTQLRSDIGNIPRVVEISLGKT